MDPKEHETEKNLEASKTALLKEAWPIVAKKITSIGSKIGKLELLMKKEKLIRISMYYKADLSRDLPI